MPFLLFPKFRFKKGSFVLFLLFYPIFLFWTTTQKTTNERHCFNVKSCIPMRIKNERELCLYFWYKTLVISTKYMCTKNKKMSETKICRKKQWYRISRESYGTIFASISNRGIQRDYFFYRLPSFHNVSKFVSWW